MRERIEDLALVCEVLLHDIGRRMGRSGYRLTKEGLAKLAGYTWPGNLRELANVLERAMILSLDRRLGPEVLDLPLEAHRTVEVAAPTSEVPPLATGRTLEEVERDHIRRVLASVGGRLYGKRGAAEILGLKPSTLQSRMKKLGIGRKEHATPNGQ